MTEMNMDDLDMAKYGLEAKRRSLRFEMASLDAEDARVQDIVCELKNIRIEMLAIQGEQDKLAVPLSPNAYNLGVVGIVSKEAVGQIGGSPKQ